MDSEIELRPVIGFSGYFVGSDGSVWSARIKGGKRSRGDMPLSDKLKRLKPRRHRSNAGYQVVSFRKVPGGKQTHCYVHRLVLQAFVGPCPDGMECCHNDGNAENNRLENLRWGTKKSNSEDAIEHGTQVCGERSHWAKLTPEDVRTIRDLASQKLMFITIAEIFSIHHDHVALIVNRKSWKHLE